MNPRSTSSGQASTTLRTGSVTDALDRIDHIAACLEAVGDLMNPEPDLHAVNRDRQALLLSFLLQEHHNARARLNQALQTEQVKGG
jgi:hypothetical protein